MKLLWGKAASELYVWLQTMLFLVQCRLMRPRLLVYWSGIINTLCCRSPKQLWWCILLLLLSAKISPLSYSCNLTWDAIFSELVIRWERYMAFDRLHPIFTHVIPYENWVEKSYFVEEAHLWQLSNFQHDITLQLNPKYFKLLLISTWNYL